MKSNPYTFGIILTLLTYLSFGILDTIQKQQFNITLFSYYYLLNLFSVLFFLFMGIFFCTGLFLQIKALSVTPASILAPYNYTIIVWGIIFGLLVYGEIPDIFTIIGVIIIVSSGIFIFRYSYK